MKKIISLLLILTLAVGLIACGGKKDEKAPENTTASTEATSTDVTSNDIAKEDIAPDVDSDTVGGMHWDKFVEFVGANPEATVEDIANAVVSLEINQFMYGAMPVEEGLLSGFDNYEVKGFKSGAMFGPMMGSIAYIGYVFELEEGADVAEFIGVLTENANPRWQICVTADQTVAGSVGNKVFFLMCPESYDVPTEEIMPEDGELAIPENPEETVPAEGEDAPEVVTVVTDVVSEPLAPQPEEPVEVVVPDVTETSEAARPAEPEEEVSTPAVNISAPSVSSDSVAGMHWNQFVNVATAGGSAEEIAAKVVGLEINQFMSGTMPVEEGLLSGFDNYEVKGFKSGAMFGPMMGSIAYIGYVFELEEGADADAFVSSLVANANPRWQICVTADQTAAGYVNNMVFFIMCPETYDVPTEEVPAE